MAHTSRMSKNLCINLSEELSRRTVCLDPARVSICIAFFGPSGSDYRNKFVSKMCANFLLLFSFFVCFFLCSYAKRVRRRRRIRS